MVELLRHPKGQAGRAFGHDPAHRRYPTVMEDYRTGGTPWFIVIEPSGQVAFNSFELDVDAFLSALPGES